MRSGAASLNLIMYFVLCLVARGGSLQDALELTPGRALAGCPRGDRSLAGNHANMTSRTIDIKVLFQLYDCKPGRGARAFRRNALQLLSTTHQPATVGGATRSDPHLLSIASSGSPECCMRCAIAHF